MTRPLIAALGLVGGLALAGTASAQLLGGQAGGSLGAAVGATAQPAVPSPGLGSTVRDTTSTVGQTTRDTARTTADTARRTTDAARATTPPEPDASADGTVGAGASVGASPSGQANASATGAANANANTGLAASTTAPDLSSLKPGMAVRNAAGETLGTVSKVEKAADGTVKTVLVAGADAKSKTMRLAPSSLSVSGDAVVTSEATHR